MNTIRILLATVIMMTGYPVFSNGIATDKKVLTTQNNSVEFKAENFNVMDFESTRLSDLRVEELVGSSINTDFFEKMKIEGFVILEYHVEINGKIKIDQLNTNNEILGNYVRKCLSKLYLLSASEDNKRFYVEFRFKVV